MVLESLLNWLKRYLKQRSSPSCYTLSTSQNPAKETMLQTDTSESVSEHHLFLQDEQLSGCLQRWQLCCKARSTCVLFLLSSISSCSWLNNPKVCSVGRTSGAWEPLWGTLGCSMRTCPQYPAKQWALLEEQQFHRGGCWWYGTMNSSVIAFNETEQCFWTWWFRWGCPFTCCIGVLRLALRRLKWVFGCLNACLKIKI